MHVLNGGKPSKNVRDLGFLNLTAVDSLTCIHFITQLNSKTLDWQQNNVCFLIGDEGCVLFNAMDSRNIFCYFLAEILQKEKDFSLSYSK